MYPVVPLCLAAPIHAMTIRFDSFAAQTSAPARRRARDVPISVLSPPVFVLNTGYCAFHARNSAHPNAQSSPAATSPSAFQANVTQWLATIAHVPAEPVIAQNP